MAKASVRDAMTENPFSLNARASLGDVSDLMDARRIRHVPILDDEGALVGVVSHRDLVRAVLHDNNELTLDRQRDMLSGFTASEVMVKSPHTVEPDESLRSAGELIYDNKYGCLPVVEGDELVGILTESDFVRYTIALLTD